MTEAERIAKLEPPVGKISMVLDSDTACEVDDQFALAYAVRAAQAGELVLEAICAEPFDNPPIKREEGMERSYQEILRVLDKLDAPEFKAITYRGATEKMTDDKPVDSPAARKIIELAMDPLRTEPLYVVGIGGATNLASALKMQPEIAEKIIVIWLGGNSIHWPHVVEFNACQDVTATKYLLDSGVPLVMLPAYNAIAGLITSIPELEYYLDGKSEIGTYLVDIVKTYRAKYDPNCAWSKVVWDIAGVAYLLHPEWFQTCLVHTPIMTEDRHWASDSRRPMMRICEYVQRDYIFHDVFQKLTQ